MFLFWFLFNNYSHGKSTRILVFTPGNSENLLITSLLLVGTSQTHPISSKEEILLLWKYRQCIMNERMYNLLLKKPEVNFFLYMTKVYEFCISFILLISTNWIIEYFFWKNIFSHSFYKIHSFHFPSFSRQLHMRPIYRTYLICLNSIPKIFNWSSVLIYISFAILFLF